MGADPVEQKIKELTPFWDRMQRMDQERVAREEQETEEVWEGFAVGDYAWLTEEASLRRGNLRMMDANGNVQTEKVKIIKLLGSKAIVETKTPLGSMIIKGEEQLDRKYFREVVKEQAAITEPKPAVQYWEV